MKTSFFICSPLNKTGDRDRTCTLTKIQDNSKFEVTGRHATRLAAAKILLESTRNLRTTSSLVHRLLINYYCNALEYLPHHCSTDSQETSSRLTNISKHAPGQRRRACLPKSELVPIQSFPNYIFFYLCKQGVRSPMLIVLIKFYKFILTSTFVNCCKIKIQFIANYI